jgi:hypothetical protein
MTTTDSTPVPPPPAVDAPPAEAAVAPPRAAWRDRLYDFRAVIAVGAAGVILGSAVGAGVSAVVGGDDHQGFDRVGFGPGQMPMGGQLPGQPGQLQGQLGQVPGQLQGQVQGQGSMPSG